MALSKKKKKAIAIVASIVALGAAGLGLKAAKDAGKI